MRREEALEWLRGERSMTNYFFEYAEDRPLAMVRTAQADAAMTEQAYWVMRAHREGLVEVEE